LISHTCSKLVLQKPIRSSGAKDICQIENRGKQAKTLTIVLLDGTVFRKLSNGAFDAIGLESLGFSLPDLKTKALGHSPAKTKLAKHPYRRYEVLSFLNLHSPAESI